MKCRNCNHELDLRQGSLNACPSCGCTFTVPDVTAGTLVFDEPVKVDSERRAPAAEEPVPEFDPAKTAIELIGATVEIPTPVNASLLVNAQQQNAAPANNERTVPDAMSGGAGGASAPDLIGMTINADRWSPTAAELADAAATGVLQTLDSHFLGQLITGSKDLASAKTDSGAEFTQMWDSNDSLPNTAISDSGSQSGILSNGGIDQTIESGSHSSVSQGSAADFSINATSDSGLNDSQASVRSGGGSASGADESVKKSGAQQPRNNQSIASGAAEAAMQQSLEQSLVIQPRVLRMEVAEDGSKADRIDYNLLRKLGEGGMGIVYAARQQSIRRVVALKMLKSAKGKTRSGKEVSQREKFLAEAVITGDLEHPNIVPIYDLGRDESGAIFYAMKHVKGTPWDKLIKLKTVQENIEILLKIADAVAFAHSKEVIHRDLKPENVMLGDFGEVLLMDWGLAMSIAGGSGQVAMGGTPAYMAPEMASGPVEAINVCSDIYLLGAILFEIVTGQRPHIGSTVTRCLMAAAKNEIVETKKSGELLEIARRAMATRPEDRYVSVRDFQVAIREYQSHTESIALTVRAQEDLEEALKTQSYETFARALFGFQEAYSLWSGNEKAKLGASSAALHYAESARLKGDFDLGLSLLSEQDVSHTPLIGQLRLAQHERNQRIHRLRTARRVGLALAASIFVIITGAFFWIRAEADRARKAEIIANNEKIKAEDQTKIAKEERAKAVDASVKEKEQREVAEQKEREAIAAKKEEERQRLAAVAAQKAADEARIVADMKRQEADRARAEEERQRQLADDARKQEEYEGYVAKIGLAAAKIDANAFDHALALINECPPELRHWEWGRLKYLCSRDLMAFDAGTPLETLSISHHGSQVAVAGWGGEVKLFSLKTGELEQTFNTEAGYVFALAFSPDDTKLAVGSNQSGKYLSVWDVASGKRIADLSGHTDAVLSVAWSRDGKSLLSGSYDNAARLWNVEDGTSKEYRGHDWWVWSARFSNDEKQIVTASQDGSVLVWDREAGTASAPFLEHSGPVFATDTSPDGQWIATAGYDKQVLLWKASELKGIDLQKAITAEKVERQATPTIALRGHTAPVRSVKFSHDGRLLISSGEDNAICVWDVASNQLVKQLRGHANRVSTALFAPDDDQIVSAGYDHRAKLWKISGYEEVKVLGGKVLKGHQDAILGAAFSPDGKSVVTASRDRSAIAWDLERGEIKQRYTEGHAYLASTGIFLPDGKQVLTGAVDGTTRIWDLGTGTQSAVLEGTGIHAAVTVTSDGQWIVTGSNDQSLRVWDSSGALVKTIKGFKSDITSVAAMPGRKAVLVGDQVGRCQLIDLETEERLWESRTHSRAITAIAFTADQKRVLTASLDRTVSVRNAQTGEEQASQILKHPEAVTALSINRDGTLAATGCADRYLRIWELSNAKVVHESQFAEAITDVVFSPKDDSGLVTTANHRVDRWSVADAQLQVSRVLDLSGTTLLAWSTSFAPDGQRILTVGGAEAHLWDLKDNKPLVSFSPQSAVASVQFAATGDRLVTGSWDNAARIWDTATGASLLKLGGVHTRFVNASAFAPDGKSVATASDDQTVRLWDTSNGQLIRTFTGHTSRVTDVAFAADGKRIVTASADKTARIWNVETGEELFRLEGHSQAVLCARYSADQKQIITGSDDTTARLWNAETGQASSIILQGHTASVTAVAFTPDGGRALTGSKDITAKLWDPATGKEILTLVGHKQELTTVAISSDGRQMLTGSRDGTAILWLSSPVERQAVAGEATALNHARARNVNPLNFQLTVQQ